MKKTRLFSLLVVMLSATLCSMAQPDGYKAISNTEKTLLITAMNTNMQSVQCSFKQEKKSALLNETAVSEGVMYFKKPSSLRWEYTSPTPSTVVMYDGKVTVSDANGGSQAKKGRMFRELATIIANVVSGKEFESEKNFKTQYYSNATSYWIKMTPATRRLKAFFNHIELTVDKARQVAVKMYMDEKEGDSTLITFSNHKVNVAIDDKMFKLK